MEATSGLICAYRLDGKSGGSALGWADLTDGLRPENGFVWVHLQRDAPDSQAWLHHGSGIGRLAIGALLAEETRPRCTTFENGTLVNLRGVNLNPGAEPEDMVSVRLWIEARFVVSTRRLPLAAVQDLRAAIDQRRGPCSPAELVSMLAERLTDRMMPVVLDLDERLDDLETVLLDGGASEMRQELGAIRRRAIGIRRYIGPQRDALAQAVAADLPRGDMQTRERLRETSLRVTRLVEDLDATRERAAAMQDELAQHLAEQANRRLYLLSLVTTIFLPLSFVTGLFGINVGGMPGIDSSHAFLFVCLALVVVAALEVILFRRLRWL